MGKAILAVPAFALCYIFFREEQQKGIANEYR